LCERKESQWKKKSARLPEQSGCAQHEGRTVPQRTEESGLKGKEPTFDWAIGWLARENQIAIMPEKRSFRIRLKQAQASAASAS